MVGWHHQLNEREFEQAPGVGEGQGSLVCCSPWGRKESDITEQQLTNMKVIMEISSSKESQQLLQRTVLLALLKAQTLREQTGTRTVNHKKLTLNATDKVQFSHSVVSDSLRPHGLQHARSSCLPPTPRVCPNACPLSE